MTLARMTARVALVAGAAAAVMSTVLTAAMTLLIAWLTGRV
jgi:hypothetical protein